MVRKITISAKELSVLLNVSENMARQYLRDIRAELNKPKGYRVTKKQVADYFEYSLEEVERGLEGKRKV